jgi:hypothetical protein
VIVETKVKKKNPKNRASKMTAVKKTAITTVVKNNATVIANVVVCQVDCTK